MAVNSSVAVPHGQLRLMLVAEPKRSDNQTTGGTIQAYHNTVIGHMGVSRTWTRLQTAVKESVSQSKQRDCPTRLQVKWFIQHCPYCQKLRLRPKDLPVARSSLMTRAPMEEVSLDVIGPLPDDGEGNKYIIVMIDNFSHFTFAEAVKSTEASIDRD